jgi:hypothetical protein
MVVSNTDNSVQRYKPPLLGDTIIVLPFAINVALLYSFVALTPLNCHNNEVKLNSALIVAVIKDCVL